MRATKASGKILTDYVELAKTLGKLPTVKEAVKHVASERQLYKHFDSFENLKVKALDQLPELTGGDDTKAKILILDIETAPIIAHVWDIWEQNVGLNQIVSDWHLLSWSAKWFDPSTVSESTEADVIYMDQRKAKNIQDDKKLLEGIWKLMNEADVVITQNGVKFDSKKLNARFVMNEMKPPSSYKHKDTFLIAKKYFGFTSNKLEYMTDKLCKKYKKLTDRKYVGHTLWTECLKGNQDAWKEMEKYNKHDVLSLEELYTVLAPWDSSTIDLNIYHNNLENTCSCGNKEFVKDGFVFTPSGRFDRYVCTSCGHELRGSSNLLTKTKRLSLKRSITR